MWVFVSLYLRFNQSIPVKQKRQTIWYGMGWYVWTVVVVVVTAAAHDGGRGGYP